MSLVQKSIESTFHVNGQVMSNHVIKRVVGIRSAQLPRLFQTCCPLSYLQLQKARRGIELTCA